MFVIKQLFVASPRLAPFFPAPPSTNYNEAELPELHF